MQDYLQAKGMWFQIHQDLPSEHLDPKGYYKCLEARDSAVGELCQHVSPELRSITLGSDDPKSILKVLMASPPWLPGIMHFRLCLL
jgi:hypothetical protein